MKSKLLKVLFAGLIGIGAELGAEALKNDGLPPYAKSLIIAGMTIAAYLKTPPTKE